MGKWSGTRGKNHYIHYVNYTRQPHSTVDPVWYIYKSTEPNIDPTPGGTPSPLSFCEPRDAAVLIAALLLEERQRAKGRWAEQSHNGHGPRGSQ